MSGFYVPKDKTARVHVLRYVGMCIVKSTRSKRTAEPSKTKWSSPPRDTRNSREVTSKLPASRVGMAYLKEEGLVERKWAYPMDVIVSPGRDPEAVFEDPSKK
ncbi:hypothetical protein EVAR_39913_1 [Eumeta japonica]|uniref:Uncharacterized protein n=1 Tax=Eumeta variegata TaxID=151549 RepID=A0A4C1WQR3_EUMVA|nr:hypothetical protein EVAR_39913_1 [Eumeta japonica]